MLNLGRTLGGCALGVLVSMVAMEPRADACGGCFRPPQEVTTVNAHRMVFSVSQQQSILWDQFSYSGNPQDFAWVLPVHADAVHVELAHDEFIAALDAWTAPTIIGPVQTSSSGFGCGSANATSFGPNGGDGVQVVNQEIVGPYEVATLRATDANALENWLAAHGYEITDAVKPTVAAYVSDGFDFLALRLQPGQGVAAMQPVRVVSNGADPTLPLRMVAAGVGSDVSILLYVISEGRYEAANFNNTQVDFTKLEWNKNLNKSNYDDLIQTAMTSGDGRNFTLEFAGHLFATDEFGFRSGRQPFKSTYYQGAVSSQKCPFSNIHGADFVTNDAGPFTFDASSDDASDASNVDADTLDADVSDGGVADASAGDGGNTGPFAPGYDPCAYDDLTTATLGMAPNDVFVTRLRADLKVSALSQDLSLHASADQSPYDNFHTTTDSGSGCRTSSDAPDRGGVVVLSLAGLALAFVLRKRRAR